MHAVRLGEHRDPEIRVFRRSGRKRDRADVDREEAARDRAGAALEEVGLAAHLQGRVRRAAEGPVGDASGRVDTGGADHRAGRRLGRQRERCQDGCEEGDPHPFASFTCTILFYGGYIQRY